MDYEAKATELVAKLDEVKDKIKGVSSLKAALDAIPDVVSLVEAEAADLAGADKKALAVAVLNKLIDIPFIPESVESVILGWAIDAVVAALNKLVGKAWLSKLQLA